LEPTNTLQLSKYYPYDIIWSMKKQRLATTTIRLDEQDKQIIARVKEYYGVKSDNDAIRLALRETLREMERQTPNPSRPER